MSVAELRVVEPAWPDPARDVAARRHHRAEGMLPFLVGIGWLLGDLAVVIGAFMVAHWLRFVMTNDPESALGIELYVRQGGVVALATGVQFLLHGFYDE